MNQPTFKKFLVITFVLILVDLLFVDVISIPGATLVFIRGYQTTVNTIFFFIASSFIFTSLNRAKDPRYYTAKLDLHNENPEVAKE